MLRIRVTLIVVVLTTLLLPLPAFAQEDRSADSSFGFAGRAEYNQSPSSTSSGTSGPSGQGFLPETGGPALLPALGAAALIGGAFLIQRASRKQGL